MLEALYADINRKIDKFPQLLDWVFLRIVIPIGFLPSTITTIINYYILDMGEDSFLLPCPMMYCSLKHATTTQCKLQLQLQFFQATINLENTRWLFCSYA